MRITDEVTHISAEFSIVRTGDSVAVSLFYGLSGYYDEEAGYYLWAGDIGSMIGDYGDYYYQDADRPMDLNYAATLVPGTLTAGYYELNDYNDGTSFRVDFNTVLFNAAASFVGTSGIDIVFGSDAADVLDGGDGDDAIEGGSGADKIAGGKGDDVLDGGADGDALRGKSGSDRYIVDHAQDRVYEALGEGDDHVFSSVSFTLAGQDIERLTLTGSGNINATGQSLCNLIVGNEGNNILDGGTNADLLTGGAGNDTYIIDNAADFIVESGDPSGGLADRIAASTSYLLRAGVGIERMTTTDATGKTAINLTGNAFAQSITGNAGKNTLSDGGGAGDTLYGLAGNDAYIIRSSATRIVESTDAAFGASDRITASVSYVLGANVGVERIATNSVTSTRKLDLAGNEQAQSLTGNNGANVLDGKGGADSLTGHGGADTFAFSTALNLGVDRITDFNVVADAISLKKAIFAAAGNVGALNANAFWSDATGLAHDDSDRILYDSDDGRLFYDADGNGNGKAVLFAVLENKAALTAADFFIA